MVNAHGRLSPQFAFPAACPVGVRRPDAESAVRGPALSVKEALTDSNVRSGGILLNPEYASIAPTRAAAHPPSTRTLPRTMGTSASQT